MTTPEFAEEIYAEVRHWADTNHYDPIIGWPLRITDLIVDNITAEEGDVVEQVRDFLERLEDHPEMYGVTLPVYTADTFSIYDQNGSDVDEELGNLGGLRGIAGDDDSISTLIFKAVTYYVDSCARSIARDLIEAIDQLEEALSEEED